MIKRKGMSVEELKDGILQGDIVCLSKGITLLESQKESYRLEGQALLHAVMTYTGKSHRIGISGVPGAGKSTFINAFGTYLCEKGYKVAVLAVDPSSTVSGGSILGDKLRMQTLGQHPNSFIRPSPTNGTLGGVNRRTRESILLCEAAGFDVILIETVGVGQVETVVRNMVDFFLLITLTGAGDEIQGIKRGILELVDGIIINKADGDNVIRAKQTAGLFQSMLTLFTPITEGWTPKVLTCSSVQGDEIQRCWEMMSEFFSNPSIEKRRIDQNIHWFQATIEQMILTKVLSSCHLNEVLGELKKDVIHQNKTVFQAIEVFASRLDEIISR